MRLRNKVIILNKNKIDHFYLALMYKAKEQIKSSSTLFF